MKPEPPTELPHGLKRLIRGRGWTRSNIGWRIAIIVAAAIGMQAVIHEITYLLQTAHPLAAAVEAAKFSCPNIHLGSVTVDSGASFCAPVQEETIYRGGLSFMMQYLVPIKRGNKGKIDYQYQFWYPPIMLVLALAWFARIVTLDPDDFKNITSPQLMAATKPVPFIAASFTLLMIIARLWLWPSKNIASQPSNTPESQPSNTPESQPSDTPESQPSDTPESQPSNTPESQPSNTPESQPSDTPESQPSDTQKSQFARRARTLAPILFVVIQSALFGFVHLDKFPGQHEGFWNILGTVWPMLFGGLILGAIACRFGLRGSILTHVLFNLIGSTTIS